MEDNKNKTKVDLMYDDLFEQGYLEKDRDTFNKFFYAPGEQGYKNRKALYDDLHEQGYLESPTYEDFAKGIGLHAVDGAQQPSSTNTSAAASGVVGGVSGSLTPGSYAQAFAQGTQGNGRPDMVESLNKYYEGMQAQNTPQAPANTKQPEAPAPSTSVGSSSTFGGGESDGNGASASYKVVTDVDGSNYRVYDSGMPQDLYQDEKGNIVNPGMSEEELREVYGYKPKYDSGFYLYKAPSYTTGGVAYRTPLDSHIQKAKDLGMKHADHSNMSKDELLAERARILLAYGNGVTETPESLQDAIDLNDIEYELTAKDLHYKNAKEMGANRGEAQYKLLAPEMNQEYLKFYEDQGSGATNMGNNPLYTFGWERLNEMIQSDKERSGATKSVEAYVSELLKDKDLEDRFCAYCLNKARISKQDFRKIIDESLEDFKNALSNGENPWEYVPDEKDVMAELADVELDRIDVENDKGYDAAEKRYQEWRSKQGYIDPRNADPRDLYGAQTGDFELKYYDTAKHLSAQTRELVQEAMKGGDFLTASVRGLYNNIFKKSTWDFGLGDLQDADAIKITLDKFLHTKNPKISPGEQALLDSMAAKAVFSSFFEKYLTTGYKAGSTTAEAIPFILEMMTGVGEGANIAAKAATKWAARQLEKYGLKFLERIGMKGLMDKALKALAKRGGRTLEKLTSSRVGQGTKQLIEKVASTKPGQLAKGLVKGTVKLGEGAVKAGVGGVGYAVTTGALKTTKGAIERSTDTIDVGQNKETGRFEITGIKKAGEDGATAWLKSLGEQAGQYGSEMYGPYLEGLTGGLKAWGKELGIKAADKMGIGNLMREIGAGINESDMIKIINDFKKMGHYDGTFNEYLEEVANNIYNAAFIGDMNWGTGENGVFNKEDNIDTYLSCLYMSGLFGIPVAVSYRPPKYRAKQDVKRYGDMAKRIFGGHGNDWSTIANLIQDNSEEARKQLVVDLMQSGKYSKREKQIALQYAGAVYKSMGMDLGESKQKRSAGDQEASDAYGRGYNMANLENISETSGVYNQLRAQMEQEYGAELMERMDKEPGLVYGWVRAGAVSEEDAQKVLNYLNAKMAYDGAMDRLNDDDAAAKAAAEAHVDDTIHTEENGGDGQIHPVALKGREGDFFVVSGNVVTGNDGNVDVEASDNDIVVVDSDGNRIMTNAKNISQVGEAIDPEAAKADAVAKIDGATQEVINGEESGESGEVIEVDPRQRVVQAFANGYFGEENVPEGWVQTMLDNPAEFNRFVGEVQKTANVSPDTDATQAPLAVEEYNQDDLVTVEVDGQQVTGIITNGLDNDGNVTIYFDEPINGRQNWQMTPEQLNQVAVSYTSRDGVKIDRSVREEESGESEEPLQQPAANGELDVQTGETPQTPAPVAEAPQQAPAQPSLPIGEDGNADFSNATPQEAHDYIYNDPELDEDEANQVVQNYADSAAEELAKAQAVLDELKSLPAPQMKDYGRDTAGYKRDKKDRNDSIAQAQAAVDAAQRDVDLWNGVQSQHMMNRAAANAAANREENPAAPSAPAPASGENENNAPTPSQATPPQGQQTTESTQEPSAPQPNEGNGPMASTTPSSSEEERGESAPVNETAGAAEEELTPDERIERAKMEALENRAEELAESCGLPVQVARSLDDLSDSHRRQVEKQHAEGKYVNGFYDPMTKQIVLFLPDIAANGGMRRLERTFLHEGVAHGGLRALFENAQNGIQTFDELCDQVWEMMPVESQAQMMNYIGVQKPEDMTQEKKRIAADEYMAHLAEWGVEPSVKSRIITAIKNALRKIGVKMRLNNNDIVSLLAASRRHLNEMDKVRDSLEDHGIATSDSGDALMFAVSDILEGDERKKAIKELMDVTGRSEATVKKWLKAEESLAKVILDNDNVELLDLQVDESVPSIWNNSDYPQGTVEFSNICRKRLPFTVIYQRLQEEFPNTVFDASTLEDIRNTMKENGVDVACGLCFVEDRRQLLGEIGEGFIKMVEGEEAGINENQQKALDKLRESGDNYVPNLYELLTLDGMKKLRKEHPAVAKAFVEFNNARGMQAGRLFQAYSAYHREILNWNKAKVKKVNDAGGLRIFSFSDFEAHHLIDLVQVLTDCAAKGVKVQGYTKVPEFAKAVKETKMKLNRSLIAKGKGYVDADYVPKEGEAVSPNVIDGKRLLLDTVEGINVNHPDFFDSTDNNNVGNILVGINDEQIRLAMADSFVDYIIPFHSGLSEAIRAKKGIGDWVNYKLSQLEKKRNDKGKLVNADKHGVNIYTDVLPRGEELIGKPIRNARDFQNAFFKACEEKGWVPRFSKFINKNKKGQYVYTPGYEKLLLDFKLFDKNGKLLPQEAVVPLFDNEFNKKILDDYVKGEKAKTPYDDLYEKIKEHLGLPNVEEAGRTMHSVDVTPEMKESVMQGQPLFSTSEVNEVGTERQPEADGGLRFSVREKPEPKKTIPVYKLMRLGDDGKLYPLFIDGTEPIELGVWYDADSPNMDMLVDLPIGVHLIDTDNGTSMTMEEYVKQNNIKLKKGQKYPPKEVIKSTPNGQRWVYIEPTERGQRRFGGESRRYWNLGINGSGSVSTFSMRPGWHAGSLPTMRQIGKSRVKGGPNTFRDDRFVWVGGLISADIDYNEEAQRNPDNDIPTHIPTDGFYLKATNANAKASQADRVGWYISGAFMPVKIMSDSEARQVIDDWNQDHPDLQVEYDFPRESGKVFNAETMQLEDEANVRFSTTAAVDTLKDDERVYNTMLGKVFSGVSNETRRGIVEAAMRDMGNDFGAATESWLMGLADNGKFAQVPEDDWRTVKNALSSTLRDMGVDGTMTDNEARYVLWKAGQIEDGVFSMAEDIVMQDELLNGASAPQYTDSADVRFSTSESEESDLRFSVTPRDRAIARDQYERYMRSGRLQWVEAMQDSMLGLKKLMQAIMGSRWTKIEDVAMYENPYIAENLMSSVTAAQQQAFYTEFMKPLLKEVGKLCKGGKKAREQAREDLTNYLMAKHGLERNQVLADRDAQETAAAGGDYQEAYAENRKHDYSGLTALTGEDNVQAAEAKAQQMVAAYEAQHNTTELWNRINAATQVTLEKQYKSGMLSYAEYQRISGMFDYYVPLRGWEETTSDQVYGYLTSKAGPFLGGGIVKRAGGRTSKADDPIATIAQMGDDSIRSGNRNLMKQTFLNFVQNHPSDAVSVSDLWLKYDDVTDEWVPVFADIDPNDSADVVEQKIQDFEQRMQELAEQEPRKYKHGREAANIPYRVIPGMEKEHQVLVKRNGQTWVLTINGNPRAAQALNGLTNPDVPMEGAWASMIKGAEWVNRTLSALYTTLSPAFIVSNFLRDTGYSNTMVWVREKSSWKFKKNYPLRFNYNYLKLNPAYMRFLLGRWEKGTLDESKRYQKYMKEFMLHGGETGFAMVQDLEKYKQNMLNEVKNMNSKNFARKSMKVLGSQYELLGRSIENCARFAAYVTSREMGRNAERAAYDAKEISVNFNKKGSGGKSLGKVGQTMSGNVGAFISGMARSLYTFWNAGVQGMTNAGRAVKRHPVKAALLGAGPLYAAGFLAPVLAQLMGAGGDGDDDKNAYYNLPEYVRRSNLCIWLGDSWLTIPLPIEFRAIYGMGELTYGVISGNERYSDEELAMQVAGQFSQLLPIDMLEGGGGFHPFIPTLFKPIVEAEQNKSWSGLPIYRDSEWNKDEPEYTKAFSNANEWIVSGAEWLNAKTGGDEFKKGWIDLNPAKIEYMLKGYLGGIYTTIDEVRRAAETALGKRDFEWRNIPLANRVIKQGDERTESKKLRDEYFKYKEDYEETKRLINKYKNAEDTDLFDYAKKLELMNYSKEYDRYIIFEKYATMLDAYQKAKNGASGEVLKKIEEDEKRLMRQLVDEMHAFEDGKTTVNDRPKLSKKDRSEDYGYIYNKLRTYIDINEDALLDSALKRAKAADDKGMVAALNSIKRSIGEMKKGLGHGKDDEVMNSIREMRGSVLSSFGIIGGDEELPEPEEQWQEEPQEEFQEEEPEMIEEEPLEEPEDDEFDESLSYE